MAVFFGFVSAGTYRGMKDTKTPLMAAVCAMTAKLACNVVFIYGAGAPGMLRSL